MVDLVVPLLAGVVVSAVFGSVVGASYHHVIVPFNEVFRSYGGPVYTGRRPASVIAHTCREGHEPVACRCPPRRLRSVLEYRGADWLIRHRHVPGRYPVGAEIAVRVSYRSNRPYPLTRTTVVRSAVLGALWGAGAGLLYATVLSVMLA
ncbi:hypothetical protein [Nocardia wallacei]|uniref:hypothetical protein n=1 Tax=Nocardia wallacei TaxID=480035 RepID=UPI0024575D08|nr:hypothetical protein [Nocardia wallacei]